MLTEEYSAIDNIDIGKGPWLIIYHDGMAYASEVSSKDAQETKRLYKGALYVGDTMCKVVSVPERRVVLPCPQLS